MSGPEYDPLCGDGSSLQAAYAAIASTSRPGVFGANWRQGRRVGRCIHMMVGVEPSENDVLIGVFDTPELAAHIVALHNDLVEGADDDGD